ncbi:hypothetical protein [Salinicoccus halitifaciens]|uniref:Uncharacterized protein n=1 Tax=Salinicoccus halitifaciens TaxID=1073415 RepID=A0ABV2E5S4_9STAP|nr:hypothetical protein [Salinicoccus halitifaciens]MCD2137178.1 hypothetical protein [Salinicoccus halitifaciens]
MEKFNNKILEVLQAVVGFVFSLDTFITLLFLLGMGVILYTIYSISLTAFGFSLGIVLIAVALLLYQAQK